MGIIAQLLALNPIFGCPRHFSVPTLKKVLLIDDVTTPFLSTLRLSVG